MTNINKSVGDFLARHDLHCGVEHRLLDVSSEFGEVCKEVLKSSDYSNAELHMTEELTEEIGDLLFAVYALANELDLDPQERLTAALEKYEERHLLKGHIGSGPN